MVAQLPSYCDHPAAKCGAIVSYAALEAGLQAGVGALTALALTAAFPAAAVIPAVGAIFGAVMGGTRVLVSSLTSPSLYMEPQAIERSWVSSCNGVPFSIANTALAIIVGALAATAFTMAMGIPITFTAIAVLVAVPVVAAGVITFAARGAAAGCALLLSLDRRA